MTGLVASARPLSRPHARPLPRSSAHSLARPFSRPDSSPHVGFLARDRAAAATPRARDAAEGPQSRGRQP
ncbi:hypothetical protein M885DRAFT_518197, partial [Pelagophyceae sp. CCMP2097]